MPDIDFAPRTYQCVKAYSAPVIDGLAEDAAWQNAAWSSEFVDITGDPDLEPGLRTRVKLLWDDAALYVLAELEEPDIQGSLTEHDSVIYQDNDFELFLDPDNDNHLYAELEINALGTVWDLLLTRPYRDGGNAVDGWDIKGLQSAVNLDGTVNDPSDTDTGWTVELAIPWHSLAEISDSQVPPAPGDRWRVNFSRVQYYSVDMGGDYQRSSDGNGDELPPENWTWSPQGIVAMHCPEVWGIVEFAGGIVLPGLPDLRSEDYARQALMCMYYWQHDYRELHGQFSSGKVDRWYEEYPLPEVDTFRDWLLQDDIWATKSRFCFSMSDGKRTISIDESGRISSHDNPLMEMEQLPADDADQPEPEEPEDEETVLSHEEEASAVRSSTAGRSTVPEE